MPYSHFKMNMKSYQYINANIVKKGARYQQFFKGCGGGDHNYNKLVIDNGYGDPIWKNTELFYNKMWGIGILICWMILKVLV